MRVHWQIPIVVFFAAGMSAGFVISILGPIAPIRMLGLIALACGALGTALMAGALRADDPEYWMLLRVQARTLLGRVRVTVDEWMHGHAHTPLPSH